MKKLILVSVSLVALSASAVAQTVYMQPPQMVVQQPQVVVAPPPVCRPYSDRLKIGAEERITRGTACLQPDGSWALQPAQAAVRYVARGGALYAVPAQPFVADIVIGNDHHHHW